MIYNLNDLVLIFEYLLKLSKDSGNYLNAQNINLVFK